LPDRINGLQLQGCNPFFFARSWRNSPEKWTTVVLDTPPQKIAARSDRDACGQGLALAGKATQRVRDALGLLQQGQLRSLGPMYLRGKSEVTEIFRADWQIDRDADATVMGVSIFKAAKDGSLEISALGRTLRLGPRDEKLTLGRATTATLSINDFASVKPKAPRCCCFR